MPAVSELVRLQVLAILGLLSPKGLAQDLSPLGRQKASTREACQEFESPDWTFTSSHQESRGLSS